MKIARSRSSRIDAIGTDFSSRSELNEWLAFTAWASGPDSDPDRYVWLGVDHGWAPAALVEVRPRHHKVPALTPSNAPRLLTLKEAGLLVRTAPETIRYWIWQGRLQAFKPGRAVLVNEAELLALCNSSKTRSYSPAPTRRAARVVAR